MTLPLRLCLRWLLILSVALAIISFSPTAQAQDTVTGQVSVLKCGIDNYPVFIPDGSNDPWVLDPFIDLDMINFAFDNPGAPVTVYGPNVQDSSGMNCGDAYPSVTKWLFAIDTWVIGGPRGDSAPPAAPTINFYAERTDINAGECTWISWNVQNVREVYFNGEGVAGESSRQVCPGGSTTYSLRVVYDGGEDNRAITINIAQPTTAPDRDDSILVTTNGDQLLQPGQDHTWRFTFRNTGTTTWTKEAYSYRGFDKWSNFNPPLFCDVTPPGAECELSMNGNAPSEPGVYTYGVIMQHNRADFGASGAIRIEVQGPPPTAAPDPTSTPAPEPTAAPPAQDGVTVSVPSGVNLRSGPGTSYNPPLYTSSSSGVYEVLGKNNGWYFACCYRGDQFWVSGGATGVRTSGDLSTVPYRAAPAKTGDAPSLQARLKFRQDHATIPCAAQGCGFDWKFSALEVSGYNQKGNFTSWPAQPLNCDPYPDQAIGDPDLCQAEQFTSNYWWSEGSSLTIEYTATPVNNIFRAGLPISPEQPVRGKCSVTVPTRWWALDRDFEVTINPDNNTCVPKN